MRERVNGVALALAFLSAASLLWSPMAPAYGAGDTPDSKMRGPLALSLATGERLGLVVLGGELALALDAPSSAAYEPFERFGVWVSPPLDGERPIGGVRTWVEARVPPGSRVDVEVRGSIDGSEWTEWQPADGDAAVLLAGPVRFVQHRITLLALDPSIEPTVHSIQVGLVETEALLGTLDKKNPPTMKIFASREGLIGRTTANGQVITAEDKFVALPSKRALNPLGKKDYQVRVTYQGRSLELPVWDVGPWNTRDNYWDPQREMFGDLPRFVPQAFAAWADNHNKGRDQYGRWVSFPTSLDISDGAFLDDLKMRTSSWVEVTFLWLDGPSPPERPTPPVLGLKALPPGEKSEKTDRSEKTDKTDKNERTAGTAKPEPPANPAVEARSEPGSRPQSEVAARAEPERRPAVSQWLIGSAPVGAGIESWLLLQNPGGESASAAVTLVRADGSRETRQITVPESGRTSLFVNQVASPGEYSVRIESDRAIYVERAVYFGQDGYVGAGVREPARQWYFPEGSTESPFETVLALHNPGLAEARVTLALVADRGIVQTSEARLAPGAGSSINLADLAPSIGLASIVSADQPILAERITFLNQRRGGDGNSGASAASRTWYFAEGDTRPGTDTWLILLNPGEAEAQVQVRALGENGVLAERTYGVPAGTRQAIYLNLDLPDARFGLTLAADQPIVAERSMYFGGGAGEPKVGGHSAIGAIEPATGWHFPEGSTASPFRETVTLANPGDAPANARIEFWGDKGVTVVRDYAVPASGRATIDVNAEVPAGPVSARVTADRPIVAEREMRFKDGRGGSVALGITP